MTVWPGPGSVDVMDRAGNFVPQGDALQGPVRGRMNLVGNVADVTFVFKNVLFRVLAGHDTSA